MLKKTALLVEDGFRYPYIIVTHIFFENPILNIIYKFRPGCADPDDRSALQRAKSNVELKYSVVGVVEQRNLSLSVMEAFMPRWFANIFDHLDHRRWLANPHPDTDEEVAAELRTRLNLDYEFYSFVVQRLQLQQHVVAYHRPMSIR